MPKWMIGLDYAFDSRKGQIFVGPTPKQLNTTKSVSLLVAISGLEGGRAREAKTRSPGC